MAVRSSERKLDELEPNHEAGMRMVMRLLAVLEALEERVATLEAMLGLRRRERCRARARAPARVTPASPAGILIVAASEHNVPTGVPFGAPVHFRPTECNDSTRARRRLTCQVTPRAPVARRRGRAVPGVRARRVAVLRRRRRGQGPRGTAVRRLGGLYAPRRSNRDRRGARASEGRGAVRARRDRQARGRAVRARARARAADFDTSAGER